VIATLGNVHFVNIDGLDESTNIEDSTDSWSFASRDPIEISGSIESAPTTAFQIPELPRGQKLVFNILSTW